MILSTSNFVPGKVIEVKGIVHACFIYSFIDRVIKKGDIDEYAYQEVDKRLKQKAEALGANAVISVDYCHSFWASKVLAHGTAVVVEPNE